MNILSTMLYKQLQSECKNCVSAFKNTNYFLFCHGKKIALWKHGFEGWWLSINDCGNIRVIQGWLKNQKTKPNKLSFPQQMLQLNKY